MTDQPPADPLRPRRPWLAPALWAGLLALLGLGAWAVLGGCGVAWPGGAPLVSFCPAPPPEPDDRLVVLQAERARERGLEDRLERLRLALLEAPACPAPPAAEAPAPEPEPPVEVAQLPPEPEPPPPPPPEVPRPDRRPTPPPPPPAPEPPPPPPPQSEPEPPPAQPPPPTSEFDRRVEREGGQRGDVQVTLIWDNVNDLDVHVYCPDGSHIWYAGMRGCGGELDIDANGGGPQTRSPVENVTWPGGAPNGTYRIEVDHFANHGGPEPTPYRLRVRVGQREEVYEGVLMPGQPPHVISVTVP